MVYLLISLDIDDRLKGILTRTSSNEAIELFIVLKDQMLIPKNLKVPSSQKIQMLKNYHFSSQRPLVEYLKSSSDVYEIKQFWVVNAIYVKVRRGAFESLFLSRNDIDIIYYDEGNFQIIEGKGDVSINTTGWNISKIKADSVWIVYGYTGNGVIVGSLDTGVDPNHPAFSGRVLAQYWLDAVDGQPNPYDDQGHGTHTIGTILGGDGIGPFADDIGVAPGAKVVACKAFNAQGQGQNSWIVSCIEHFANLKANFGVEISVINNSWGSLISGYPWLWNAIWNGWRTNDIIPVFAIGNSGPDIGTAKSPGDYPIVLAVGAVDENDNVSDFSSRGPTSNMPPYNDQSYWSRPDWNYIKPDIAAPGVGILSSWPGGSYQIRSGTSMAAPHVTGVVALMLEKNPNLDYYQVYQIITDYARIRPMGCGSIWPNNECGWGRIDAMLAIENTPQQVDPYVSILSNDLQDANNNGYLEPWENANLDITIKNKGGSDAYNVIATLSTNSSIITITDNTINFGSIASNTTRNGNSINDLFGFQVSGSAQIGDTITLQVTINYNDALNNQYQISYNIPFTIGGSPLPIVDVDTGTALLSIPDNGSIGYPNVFYSYFKIAGKGFRFPKSDSSSLFYGSFAFGNSTNYLVDNFYSSDYKVDKDIKREIGIYPSSLFGGPLYGHEEYILYLSDGNFSSPKNIKVYLNAYGKINSPFVFLKYNLKNEGNSILDSAYMAVFADFNLGNSQLNDDANTFECQSGQLKGGAYMSSPDFTGYVGVILVEGSWGNARVANHNPWPYSENYKWGMITGTSGSTSGTNANFSVSVSSGPYNLNVGDSAMAVFAFFGSNTQPDCNMVEFVEREYANLSFKFYFKDSKIKLIMPVDDNLDIKIYSINGRISFSKRYDFKKGSYEMSVFEKNF